MLRKRTEDDKCISVVSDIMIHISNSGTATMW